VKDGKIIVISAPSGSGKTTLVKYLLSRIQILSFQYQLLPDLQEKTKLTV